MIVYEKAPAKINLAIDVLGKRPDGFHEVEMVMTTIDLFDWLELSPLEEDRIEVSLESRFVISCRMAAKAAFSASPPNRSANILAARSQPSVCVYR